MDIHIIQKQENLLVSEKSVKNLVENFLNFHKVSFDEVSIYFVDTKTICDMHEKFFDDPSPTDCISFPMDDHFEEGYRVMGDVFVCPETAIKYSEKHGGETYKELTLYVVHGLLHLLGYDDIEDDDQQEMREAESSYLEIVEKKKHWLYP